MIEDIWTSAFPRLTENTRILSDALRLVTAAILGGVIGIQRERQHKAAGTRTHMLVALGTALFVISGLNAGQGIDAVSRVIQGIATGIGFLGSGAIIKSSAVDEVHGLTSAATIWLTAGLGIAVGHGQLAVAIVIVILAWLVLSAVAPLERWIRR